MEVLLCVDSIVPQRDCPVNIRAFDPGLECLLPYQLLDNFPFIRLTSNIASSLEDFFQANGSLPWPSPMVSHLPLAMP